MPSFQLVVRRGPKSGETFDLKAQTVIIGRDSTADIIINDPEVSRNHCRLILDRSYHLQDLGSTNGTFVDGQRLGGEPLRLSNGQILQLGSNVTLLYQEMQSGEEIVSTVMVDPEEESKVDVALPSYASTLDQDPVPEPIDRFSEPPEPFDLDPYAQVEESIPPADQPISAENRSNLLPGYDQEDEYLPFDLDRQEPARPPSGAAQNFNSNEAIAPPPASSTSLDAVPDLSPAAPADSSQVPASGPFWSTWTRTQWIIAGSVLAVILLAACCLIVLLAVVLAQNPELLNLG